MIKYLLIFLLSITMIGCSVVTGKIALTILGVSATTIAANKKRNGDKEKAEAILKFRDEVESYLKEIMKEIKNGR